MTAQPEQPELVEQLSAFLDGELDPEARRQVEELLASDPTARAELKRLEQAWDFLDSLPRSEVTPSFTQTTVAMIALAESDTAEDKPAGPVNRNTTIWIAIAAGLLVAASAGFFVVRATAPNQNDQLLTDLPILENLEAYRQAGNVKFLEQLQAKGLFKSVPVPTAALPSYLLTPTAERRSYVEHLSASDKEHLVHRQERFQQLEAAEQKDLRELNDALATAAKPEDTWQTMQRYHEWLTQLPPAQRAELLALDDGKRIERIGQFQAEEARRTARKLSSQDMQVVINWIDKRFMDNVMPERRAVLMKLPEEERHRAILQMLAQRPQQSLEPGRWLPPARDTDLSELREKLSDQARQQMATAGTQQQRMQLFVEWTQQAMNEYIGRAKIGVMGPGVSEAQLKQFVETLPPKERAEIMQLPPNEMQRRVRWLYNLRNRPDAPGFTPNPNANPGQRPFRPNIGQGQNRKPDNL